MRISKFFHYLYFGLLLLPLGVVIFNFASSIMSGSVVTTSDFLDMFYFPTFGGVSATIGSAFDYCLSTMFGLSGDIANLISELLTYWLIVSLVWLVFDFFMYVPLLVHRWLDKGVLE